MKMKPLFLFLLGAILLAACGGGGNSSGVSAAPESVPAEYAGKTNPLSSDSATDGAQVFKTNCEVCHGSSGKGDGPMGQSLEPKPKNLAELQSQVGDDYLYWRVFTGKPGTSMAPWGSILTEEQIWQTVTFIRTLK